MTNVVPLRRHSLDDIVREVEELGADSRGVINVILKADGRAHFRISGFLNKGDLFLAVGLLDWVKADLLSDIV